MHQLEFFSRQNMCLEVSKPWPQKTFNQFVVKLSKNFPAKRQLWAKKLEILVFYELLAAQRSSSRSLILTKWVRILLPFHPQSGSSLLFIGEILNIRSFRISHDSYTQNLVEQYGEKDTCVNKSNLSLSAFTLIRRSIKCELLELSVTI